MKKLCFVALLCATAAFAQARRPTNIPRGEAPTPEVRSTQPGKIPNGKATEIVIKGANFPTGNVSLAASGECKLIKGVMAGPNEAHFTVISTTEEGGSCGLEVRGNPRMASGWVDVEPTAAVAAKREKEQQEYEAAEQKKQQEQQKAFQNIMDNGTKMVGKKWAVTLPNGKADTWTFQEAATAGGEFKSGAGDKITIMLQPEDKVMVIYGEGCILHGTLKNGKVGDGMQDLPANMCKVGQGKWSASISQ